MQHMYSEERNKLIKVRIDYQGNGQWQLRPEATKSGKAVSKGKYTFRGTDEEFRKFLVKHKVSDTDSEPAGRRNKKYADIVQDMKKNKATYVWMYSNKWNSSNKIKQEGENHMKSKRIREMMEGPHYEVELHMNDGSIVKFMDHLDSRDYDEAIDKAEDSMRRDERIIGYEIWYYPDAMETPTFMTSEGELNEKTQEGERPMKRKRDSSKEKGGLRTTESGLYNYFDDIDEWEIAAKEEFLDDNPSLYRDIEKGLLAMDDIEVTEDGDIFVHYGGGSPMIYRNAVEPFEESTKKSRPKKEQSETIEIPKEMKIPGTRYILEKGDRIEVITEGLTPEATRGRIGSRKTEGGSKMRKQEEIRTETEPYYAWAASAIINGDYSGLTDEEEEQLEAFLDWVQSTYGRNADIVDASEEPNFRNGPPAYLPSEAGRLGGDFLKYTILIHENSKKKGQSRKQEATQVEDTVTAIKRALRADLEVDEVEFERGDSYEGFEMEADGRASNGESEWIVFTDSDKAEQAAVERVKQDLEMEPEIFNTDFLYQHIYITDADRRMIAIDESTDMVDEVLDTDEILERADMADDYGDLQEEYDKLEDEALQADVDRQDEINDRQKEILKQQEGILIQAREDVQNSIYEEVYQALEDPIQYFVEDQGMFRIEELFEQPFIQIDVEQAAMEAVNIDGVAHFLDPYDGEEEEITDPKTGETFIAYGMN